MLTKTKIALAAVLFAGTASIASAQEFDGNLANRYPTYNGPVAAAPSEFQSAPVRLEHRRLHTAPVALPQDRFQGGFPEPITRGAGHAPGAFYEQQQPGFPQSPPGGGY